MIRYISLLLFVGLALGQNSPNPQRFNKNPEGDNVSIDLFRLWDKKNSAPKYPVVFVGSSSIRKWSTAEYFPDIPIVNRGFGGSHISDVNHFINETVLKHNPRVIIFYAGDNDINYGKSPKIVLKDYIYFSQRKTICKSPLLINFLTKSRLYVRSTWTLPLFVSFF